MKKITITLSLVFAMFITSCNETQETEVKVVSPEEMQTLLELEDVQLVDVRTAEEYKEGYIMHSQNIDFNSPTFEEDIIKLDKTKPVILYCKSGGRSAKCSKKLKEAGFIKVYDLEGGITEWEFKGLEIKTFN
ncbi:rhodanese-like domain-containing protein [Ichthyenterobacterium magnum]|uniref:Rhodanese-related sulfurtransferase n=1 Tax=Ichthyenterobacterium magnum TaxID=1230530 RepID=A0A420DVE0_9FLAO|nr:rhodanese-like domain-containing protein [Ichthyenterobacterium magnum]RKE98186.1 rhodanese-related sulfurtransferase [Ichthyenterobacterium magnum]